MPESVLSFGFSCRIFEKKANLIEHPAKFALQRFFAIYETRK
jgi:hypothetical protein